MFGQLLRFRLRRDRSQLVAWGLVHFVLMYLVVAAVQSTYGTVAVRAATIRVMLVTPAILMFRGTPQGTSEGAFVALVGLAFIALLVALQSTFLVVRHTRAEEERGQAETIAATAAARFAPTFAVIALGVIASAIATVALALAALAGGLPAAGAWLFGAACGTVGLSFVGVALVIAQLQPTSRAANAWSSTIAVLAYVLRGLGDAAGTAHPDSYSLAPAWPTWISPIGWAQTTRPWAEERAWPLLLGLASFVVLSVVALLIQDRRDVGAGVFAERKGRLAASPALGGAFGLAFRLERAALIAWTVCVVFGAILLGGLSGAVVDQLAAAGPGFAGAITRLGGGQGGVLASFANLAGIFSALLASAICVQGGIRLRQEESNGGADNVLSTAVGRTRWMLSFLVVSAVGAVVSLLLAGLVAGALAGEQGGGFGRWFGAIAWQIPAVLVFLGVVALVFALLPRATSAIGWAIFGLAALFGMFGPLLGLPSWVSRLTPFAHSAAVALPDPSYTGAWVMSLLVVALLAASVALFRLRDTRA
jgi:ABC-2 type transport system permease protein